MHFTFDRNDTYKAVAAGQYDSIRIFHLDHNPAAFRDPQWLVNASAVVHNWTVSSAAVTSEADQCTGSKCSRLDEFSAACFYFAQALTDRMALTEDGPVPLGMIESAYGGTTIEQWLSVDAQLQCSNVSCHANSSLPYSKATAERCTHDSEMGNGGLYNGMVLPFANMTITGWLWYQGENNLFAHAGSSLDQSGYACLLQRQISNWRSIWSAASDTSPTAPFGIVTLADGTDEGWGCNMAQMHWAETLNFGVVPNPLLPNVFLATAHDLGEPWDDGCKSGPDYCCVCSPDHNPSACGAGPESEFNPITKFPWIIQRNGLSCNVPSTPQLMGGVHPSSKQHVGDRLAQAAWAVHYGHNDTAYTGPVVAACGLVGNQTLTIRFNESLLAGDTIRVRAYNRTEKASATFVRVSAPLPDDAWRNYLYNNRQPWWGDDGTWTQVEIAQTSGSEISLDLSPIQAELARGSRITAVKYGHGIPGLAPQNGHRRVCCGTRDISKTPCPPANCPISLERGGLPAMPFMARVDATGDCQGLKPQVITGLRSRLG